MSKFNEIIRAKDLLNQALSVALNSMPNDKSVQEAKIHMRKALSQLDNVAKEHIRKKSVTENQFKTWWGNLNKGVANLAHQPMAGEASVKSLKQLNMMIAEEQKKIDEIEKKADEKQSSAVDKLLND